MMFGLIRRTDPICGMKEKEGEGFRKDGRWFCNKRCLHEYEEQTKKFAGRYAAHHCCK